MTYQVFVPPEGHTYQNSAEFKHAALPHDNPAFQAIEEGCYADIDEVLAADIPPIAVVIDQTDGFVGTIDGLRASATRH